MACGEQDATHLCKRGVSLGSEQGKDESGLGLNGHRPTISSLALGRYIACRKRLRHPSDRAGCPNLEMRRSLTPGHAAIDCINHTLAKVGRERFRRCQPAPFASRHDESETARLAESQSDFIGSRNALEDDFLLRPVPNSDRSQLRARHGPVWQGGSLLFRSKKNVNRAVGPDDHPRRPELPGVAQGAGDVGLFHSRRDSHGARVYNRGVRPPKGMKPGQSGGETCD